MKGILYLNSSDLGWNPIVQKWLDSRKTVAEKFALAILFEKYVPPCLEVVKSKFKQITPIIECSHVINLCNMLDCLITPENTPNDCPKDWYEVYFIWACIWAIGGALYNDQVKKIKIF